MNWNLLRKFLLFITILGCNQTKKTNIEVGIINQNFLNMVDTIAYKYNTLRPSPLAKTKIQENVYPITLYDKLINIYEWETEIISVINNENIELLDKENFKKLFAASKNDTAAFSLKITDINNIGKFKLSLIDERNLMKKSGYIGHLKFSRVINNGEIGLMVVTIQDNIKSGVERLLLFKKNLDKWNIVLERELSIW